MILQVHSAETRRVVVSLNYAFEPPGAAFEDEPQHFLDPMNVQSEMADEILQLFYRMTRDEPSLRARLVEHYELWKRVVDDPAHPDHSKGSFPEPRRSRISAGFSGTATAALGWTAGRAQRSMSLQARPLGLRVRGI